MRRDERLDRAQLDCRHYPSPSVACSEVQRERRVASGKGQGGGLHGQGHFP